MNLKKVCSKCGRSLPLSEFYKNKNYKDGLRSHCKNCRKEYQKEYRKTHKEQQKEYKKEYDKAPSGRYTQYRHRAKHKNRVFQLTLAQFEAIITKPCIYCGSNTNVGIDRIDSGKGYIPGNVAPCCTMCNKMKLDHSTEKFLHHCERIAAHCSNSDLTYKQDDYIHLVNDKK